jgi:hypothetical protein
MAPQLSRAFHHRRSECRRMLRRVMDRENRISFSRRLRAPSPRLRGEGWDEGALPHAQTRAHAPSPGLLTQSVLSPHAGRGENRISFSRPHACPRHCEERQRRSNPGRSLRLDCFAPLRCARNDEAFSRRVRARAMSRHGEGPPQKTKGGGAPEGAMSRSRVCGRGGGLKALSPLASRRSTAALTEL